MEEPLFTYFVSDNNKLTFPCGTIEGFKLNMPNVDTSQVPEFDTLNRRLVYACFNNQLVDIDQVIKIPDEWKN